MRCFTINELSVEEGIKVTATGDRGAALVGGVIGPVADWDIVAPICIERMGASAGRPVLRADLELRVETGLWTIVAERVTEEEEELGEGVSADPRALVALNVSGGKSGRSTPLFPCRKAQVIATYRINRHDVFGYDCYLLVLEPGCRLDIQRTGGLKDDPKLVRICWTTTGDLLVTLPGGGR